MVWPPRAGRCSWPVRWAGTPARRSWATISSRRSSRRCTTWSTSWLKADARPEHLVRLTWYVCDKQEYLKRSSEVGEVYRRVIGRHFPAMTLVQVAALVEDRARVEIEATAVVPKSEA